MALIVGDPVTPLNLKVWAAWSAVSSQWAVCCSAVAPACAALLLAPSWRHTGGGLTYKITQGRF